MVPADERETPRSLDFEEDYKGLRDHPPLGLTKIARPMDDVEACDPASTSSVLHALAVGARGNAQAEGIYSHMMDLAVYRGGRGGCTRVLVAIK